MKKNDKTEMKNINAKRKTESNIRIFKDWLSTVGEHRNPYYRYFVYFPFDV